jgi:hypothetical protein
MNLEDNLIKKILSLSFDDLKENRIGSLETTEDDKTCFKWRGRDQEYVRFKKRYSKPFTGLVESYDYEITLDGKETQSEHLSKTMYLGGKELGPEISVGSFQFNLCGGNWGLSISLNHSDCYKKKLFLDPYNINTRSPEYFSLRYFGAEIANWYRNRHASKFSIKFYDKFIKQSLTQDNLIKQIESIYTTKLVNYAFVQEIVHILKSINNFETFLNDEMNLIKEKFKDFKKIETITDCANLLFIFNPLFKDVIEFEFKKYYVRNIARENEYRHKLKIKKIKKQRREIKKKFENGIEQTKFDF